ncbi:MAG: hypothetical protein KDD62_09690 [Bdellovibrionales bacterium]|nr:hypothetical protein [Bdellovibrionales bacterium]
MPIPQCQAGELEIVAWDSSCTLCIGFPEELAQHLKVPYPDIKDLDQEIHKRS